MTTRNPLEELYQARDALDAALHEIKATDPAEVAQTLSSYYRVSITLLQNTCAVINELSAQAEQGHSRNPHVHIALTEIRALGGELAECTVHAAHGQATADQLHQDETRPDPGWATTRFRY